MTFKQRAHDLVAQMTVEEKMSQMRFDSPAIPRLGVPAYVWWNECLHGVARQGTATVFPQATACPTPRSRRNGRTSGPCGSPITATLPAILRCFGTSTSPTKICATSPPSTWRQAKPKPSHSESKAKKAEQMLGFFCFCQRLATTVAILLADSARERSSMYSSVEWI